MSDPVTGTQALIVTLSFGMPRQSRQLKAVAEDIEEQHHAESGVTTAAAWYFRQKQGKDKIDALAELKAYNGLWKKEHDRLAKIPWAGTAKLLPAALVQTYLDMRSGFERGAPAKLAEFMEVYEDWRVTAPHRMGELYRADDFPSGEECRERIRWETTLMPLPDEQGWQRVALINPEHVAAEATRTNEAVARAREEGRRETWSELIHHFEHIVTTLSSDRPRIFQTLIGNLNSMLALVPAYNALFNDGDLMRCAEEAKATLGQINVEDLRADPGLRASTVTTARDLLARFGALGARRFA